MKGWLIVTYEKGESGNPQIVTTHVIQDCEAMLSMVVEYTEVKVKFCVFEIGKCVGDFS